MVKQFKTKSENIYFYPKYINIIKGEISNKIDTIIKYNKIEVVSYKKKSNLNFIYLGIAFFVSGVIFSYFVQSIFFLGLFCSGFLVLLYYLTMKEIIEIKSSSHIEEILYSKEIYEHLIEKIE